MPPVIKIKETKELVKTENFPKYADFSFIKEFNCVQSSIFGIFNKDCNAVIAAKTGVGKTICAEMFMAHEVRERKGKCIYLAPLKALANEKIQDWTHKNHHFHDLKLSICTGDFRLTPDRKKEIEQSNIIIMTPEMLNSRCRNYKSENNEWLNDIGTIVVDESHLLTVPNRGDHLEVALMKLGSINSKTRFVLLSATMPNVQEIADWISYNLTGKETYLLESDYRPCPLGVHFELYEPQGRSYEDNEIEKIRRAVDIIESHKEDKFLVFVHTKKTGALVVNRLKKLGYEAEFHSADLDKESRMKLEEKFRTGKLHICVATSTLAWGCNLPARRVIIMGVHRGMQEVETYDIWQMIGRSGRPGYDPRGDAYVLIPENYANEHMERIEKQCIITSRLLDSIGEGENKHYKTLAFHLVSEIHHGNIKNKQEVHKWFEKSFAFSVNGAMSDRIVNKTIDSMIRCGAIKEEEGIYKTTAIGVVSSLFYFSPFDVSDLRKNFSAMFKCGEENNDLIVSMCLGNTDSNRCSIVSKAEKEDMKGYQKRIEDIFEKGYFQDSAIKSGFCYFCLMKGASIESLAMQSRQLQFDFPRTAQVLQTLDAIGCKWNKVGWLKDLNTRISYGVDNHLVPLCRIEGIGKVRAQKLYERGIKNINDFKNNPDLVSRVTNINIEKVKSIIDSSSKS